MHICNLMNPRQYSLYLPLLYVFLRRVPVFITLYPFTSMLSMLLLPIPPSVELLLLLLVLFPLLSNKPSTLLPLPPILVLLFVLENVLCLFRVSYFCFHPLRNAGSSSGITPLTGLLLGLLPGGVLSPPSVEEEREPPINEPCFLRVSYFCFHPLRNEGSSSVEEEAAAAPSWEEGISSVVLFLRGLMGGEGWKISLLGSCGEAGLLATSRLGLLGIE